MREVLPPSGPCEPVPGVDPFAGDAEYWAALELTPKQRANLANAGKVLGGTLPAKPRKWDADPHSVYSCSPGDATEEPVDVIRAASTYTYDGAPTVVELKDVPDPVPQHLPNTPMPALLQHLRPE